MATSAATGTNPLDNLSIINVSALVSQTIATERIPQDSLKATLTSEQAKLAAYQDMNSSLSALQNAALPIIGSLFATSPTWATSGVTSSNGSVAATATSSATSGEYQFNVTQLAKSHSLLFSSGVSTSAISASGPIVIKDASGLPVLTLNPKPPLTTPSSSLTISGVVSLINSEASSPIRAAMVGDGSGTYRLQLTSKSSGTSGEFSVTGLEALGAGVITQQSQNARIQFGSNPTNDVASSSTNTFADIFPGVTFTVSSITDTDPMHSVFTPAVTLTVSDNTTSMDAQVSALVNALNSTSSAISTATHKAAGNSNSGALSGDNWLRTLPQKLSHAFVDGSGVGATALGLSVDKNGAMTFDSATFNAAFASDPQTVKATVAEMARQIGVVTKDATAATSGQITRALAEKQSSIDSLNRRISDWDDKLTARQTLLTQIYSKINANLGTLKTTSDWISQQITVLTTKSTG